MKFLKSLIFLTACTVSLNAMGGAAESDRLASVLGPHHPATAQTRAAWAALLDSPWVAADMLSQAEHGADSPSLLVTPSAALADAVGYEYQALSNGHMRATTHGKPTYVVDGVIHYCVANMPGAVAKTSTLALTNATLPYAVEIANKGWQRAMQENQEIKLGANVIDGKVTYQAVAEAFGMEYTPVETLI